MDSDNITIYHGHGLSPTLINRLQRVQNAATGVVARAGRREHITPMLFHLHWLPVQHRITFKNLQCAARSWPCVSHRVAGHLPTISGTKIRPAAASPRPQTMLRTYGHRSLPSLLQSCGTVCQANPGSCQPGRRQESPQNLPSLDLLTATF